MRFGSFSLQKKSLESRLHAFGQTATGLHNGSVTTEDLSNLKHSLAAFKTSVQNEDVSSEKKLGFRVSEVTSL